MCDCSGDASCVLRFCRAISLDAPKVADVRAAADCVEDLRGAAPDEVEAICAQWKVLAKGKFRRAVAALQAEVRQGADGAFDLDDAAPVTPAAREGEVRAAVARDGGGPEEAPAPEAPAPAPAEWLASRSGVRVGATVEKRFPGYGVHRGTIVELGADDVVVKWETDERTTLSLKEASRRVIAAPSRKTERVAPAPAPAVAPPTFRVGDLVVVAPDTSPGNNREGGAGTVVAANADGTFDVRSPVSRHTMLRVPPADLAHDEAARGGRATRRSGGRDDAPRRRAAAAPAAEEPAAATAPAAEPAAEPAAAPAAAEEPAAASPPPPPAATPPPPRAPVDDLGMLAPPAPAPAPQSNMTDDDDDARPSAPEPAAAAPPTTTQAQPAWAAVCAEVLAAIRDGNLMGVRDRLVSRGFRCGPVYNGSKQKPGQGYYNITVPPAFPASYYLIGKRNKGSNANNQEVLRSKTQLVKYLEACLVIARTGGVYRTQAAREAERRGSDDDDDDEDAAPAPAAQVEAAPPAEAEAPAPADESEEANADEDDDDDEEEDPELAAIEDNREAEAALIAEGERRLAAATEDEIRAAAPYAEGDQVEARFRGAANWYPAVVVALVVDARGSYFVDLRYADGSDHAEEAVPVELVRPLQKRRRSVEEEAVVEAPAPAEPAPVPADAVRVLHKFSGYGDYEGSVVSTEADGAHSVKWDADGSTTTLTQTQFERARRRYAEKHGLMPPPANETSGRPKKGAHDTRAPPAPARGRQAPTPARTPTTQKRSPRAAPRRWSADEEASLRRLVGELGNDAWATIAERLGTGRSASACEQKWQSLMNWTDLTPAPPPRAPPPEATPLPDAPTPPERPAKRPRPQAEEAPTAARPYPVGTQVEARFKGGAKFYAAIVVAARDGAVDVTYCDGSSDSEANVPLDLVRPLQRRKRTAVAAPPAPPPAAKKPAKKRPKPKPATKATSAIWDNGSSWRPRAEAGTRNPAYHGCGKCRWRPSGCRGCIAADAERGPQPPPRPLVRGAVTVAADKFLAPLLGAVGVPDAERRACWAGQRQTLESLVSVTSAGVVDENGFGVVAKQPLRADQIIIDPTVLLVPRPSDYARATCRPTTTSPLVRTIMRC